VKCITCSLPALQTPRVTSACGPRNLKLRRPTVYPASIFADEEKRPARWVKMLAHEPCRRVCSVMRSFTWRRCRNPADFKEMLEGPIVRDPRRHKPSRHAAYPEQSGKVLVARLQVSCPSVRLRHSVGRASTRGAMAMDEMNANRWKVISAIFGDVGRGSQRNLSTTRLCNISYANQGRLAGLAHAAQGKIYWNSLMPCTAQDHLGDGRAGDIELHRQR